MNQREKYGIIADIRIRLAELGAEDWYIERLARKIFQHFPDDPIEVIDSFHQNGWHPSDIYHWLKQSGTLKEGNPFWADSYYHVFFLEKMFINAGLSQKTAHSLVITQPWMFTVPPFTLEFSLKTLIHLGYDEDVIKSIANRMHYVFLWVPDHIIDMCKQSSEEGRGLLSNAKLAEYKPDVKPVYYQRNKKSPSPAKSIESKKPSPGAGDAPEAALPAIVRPVKPQKRDIKSLPPLKLFDPSANPVHTKFALPPSRTVEGTEPTKKKITYREPSPDDDVVHDSTALDLKRLKTLLEAANPDADEDLWDKYYAEHSWLSRPDSCEYKACLLLNLWASLNSEATPEQLEYKTDFGKRARFWIAILTDERSSQILQINREVLELRMYILRRINRDFLTEPEWLLCEWEVLDEVELRYRINEIAARGKKPHLKPYINMILEPERAKFMQRLTKFLATRVRTAPSYLPEVSFLDEEEIIITPASIEVPEVTSEQDAAGQQLELPGKPMTKEELKAKLLASRKKK